MNKFLFIFNFVKSPFDKPKFKFLFFNLPRQFLK